MNDDSLIELVHSYTLPEKDHKAILESIIFPRFLEGATSSYNPRLILKTGQCGAGKSCASQLIASTFDSSVVPVDFSTDMLRRLHPKCDEIKSKHYRKYDSLLKKDAYQWQKELLDAAMQKKANIIFEKVLTETDDWKLPLFQLAKENGYEVECVAMGVHKFQSLAGMYYRREQEYANDPYHLLIPIPNEKHDNCYQRLPITLLKMDTFKTVDIISIYNRDLSFRWSKDLRTGVVNTTADKYLSIMDAVNESRNSFIHDPQQLQIVFDHLSMAKTLMKQRNENTPKIGIVTDLKSQLDDFISPNNKMHPDKGR